MKIPPFIPLLLLCTLGMPFITITKGQSLAMEGIAERHQDAFPLVFYYSTLKMLIPEENPEFKALIRDVEKIKFLRFDKDRESASELPEIIEDLQKEQYEEIMTVRQRDNNLIVYLREKSGTTRGIFFLFEEDSAMMAFDLIGHVPIDKLMTLSNEIESLTEFESLRFGDRSQNH